MQEHHETISKDQIPTLKSACKRSAPAEIGSCPLCPWTTAKDGKVDRGAMIDHIAEDVHAFSLRSLPWGPDVKDESKERIEHGAAKVRAWLMKYQLSSAATQEIPPLMVTERPSVPHYFDINEYFAENVESSNGSGSDSNNTRKPELKKLQEEVSLPLSDSSNKASFGK